MEPADRTTWRLGRSCGCVVAAAFLTVAIVTGALVLAFLAR